jgi:hypothetical protein
LYFFCPGPFLKAVGGILLNPAHWALLAAQLRGGSGILDTSQLGTGLYNIDFSQGIFNSKKENYQKRKLPKKEITKKKQKKTIITKKGDYQIRKVFPKKEI